MQHFIHIATFEYMAAEHMLSGRRGLPWMWIATSREGGIRPDRNPPHLS